MNSPEHDAAGAALALDQRARHEALDTRRSMLLQAPAGSGKTTVLTARFLALLASVDAPEEILAITFTRKAAAEMQHRILTALQAAGAGQSSAGIAPRLLQAARARCRAWLGAAAQSVAAAHPDHRCAEPLAGDTAADLGAIGRESCDRAIPRAVVSTRGTPLPGAGGAGSRRGGGRGTAVRSSGQ